MQDLKPCLLPRKSSHELPGENEGNASALLLGFDPLDSLLIQGQRSVTNYQTLKRVLDIGLALPILVFALPPLLILMLLVLCTSGWPIFYPQLRVGLHGRPFRMYKLRTMVVNADHYLRQQIGLAHTWQLQGKLRNDPRVTRLGRLLRRSSLDELPQILNILRGEMSLVGPRPIQFSELDRFGTFSELRHSVRPGLTCFWQVQGRSQLGYEQRCLLDCLYILKCSLREDLRILVRTFPVVLTGKGAY
jgi:exopolysaccharide production protein ExoY